MSSKRKTAHQRRKKVLQFVGGEEKEQRMLGKLMGHVRFSMGNTRASVCPGESGAMDAFSGNLLANASFWVVPSLESFQIF